METTTSGSRPLESRVSLGEDDGDGGFRQHPARWEDFARQHTAGVQQHARRFTDNLPDAEDLTQDALLRALRAFPQHRVANVEGWLYRITLNLFIDQLRRRQRVCFVPLPRQVQGQPDQAPGPEDLVVNTFFEPDIQGALDALAPGHVEVLLLRDVAGYTDDEIATALHLPRGTVASRVHRAHAQLRAALAHRAPAATLAVAS